MTFSGIPHTLTHLSENCPLLKVDELKYLGVTLTSDINWANHACSYQGRIQQVAEGARAPPCLGKIICLCLTHWQIEVKIEVTLRLGTSRLSSCRPI